MKIVCTGRLLVISTDLMQIKMGAIILFVQEDIDSKLLPYVNLGNAVQNSLIWFQEMFSSFWFIET